MAQTAASTYSQLGSLLANRPGLEGRGQYGDVQHQWLGRVQALVEEVGSKEDKAEVGIATGMLAAPSGRSIGNTRLMTVLYRILARAEFALPADLQGAFINVGQEFTALQAIGKVLGSATSRVLVVDPYLNATSLFDFITTVPDAIEIRLLCDSQYQTLNAQLKSAVARWQREYGAAKPIQARASAPKTLHDRLVLVDESAVWNLSQSLKDFAGRSPASLAKLDLDTAAMKFAAYDNLWRDASPL
jgi:hypothetical protein